VPYRIVVEPQERDQYASVIDEERILVLPFSNLGKGSIPARNWVWEHSIQEGHDRHWIIDDNIKGFFRFNRNLIVAVNDGTIFQAAEDFVDRFTNVPMAGFQYEMFAPRRGGYFKPFRFNTRVYSIILLSNTRPKTRHKWRGRYNEDTDLSLRFLKDGYCTILFNAFLGQKMGTMRMKGGNTDELYQKGDGFDGRLTMAKSLQKQHPDVVKVVRKWNRWQHQVDYRPFRKNKLRRRPGLKVDEGVNEYGMELIHGTECTPWAAAKK
jgi:hypothetical protein